MLTALDLRAGVAVAGVSLGGLAIGAAVSLVTAPLTPHLAVARTTTVSHGPAGGHAPAVETATFETIKPMNR